MVGITTNSQAEIESMTEPKLEFAEGIDTKAKLATAVGVTSVPCVLLLNPKGVVLYQGHPAALTEDKLQAILARQAE